jgi:hypothetical protein
MTDAEKRVRRLEKKFEKANQDLRDFEEDHAEIFDELRKLATLREAVLQELEIAVRETRIGAAGMQVTIVPRREFDGAYLWKAFEGVPDTRDRLVHIEYKVNTKEFDSMQRAGMISGRIAEKAVVDVKDQVRIDHKPKPFQLG